MRTIARIPMHVFVIFSIVFIGSSASAGSVNTQDLAPLRWERYPNFDGQNLAPPPPQAYQGACNYMYLDNRNELLYYGTTKNCRKRIIEHNNIYHYLHVLFHDVLGFDEGQLRRRVKDRLFGQDPMKSDVCNYIQYPTKIYVTPAASGAHAKNIERCVLYGEPNQDQNYNIPAAPGKCNVQVGQNARFNQPSTRTIAMCTRRHSGL